MLRRQYRQGKKSAFGSRKTCPGGAGVGLARGHGHLLSLHMVSWHQLGKRLCCCTALPSTASSILLSPLGHGGPPCTGHGRTSELPGKGDSLPVQAPLQTRLPLVSSSGEGFRTARTYSFKIEAGAANVKSSSGSDCEVRPARRLPSLADAAFSYQDGIA